MIPLLGLLSLWSSQAATTDRIAAVVNDDVIVLSEVYELGADYISEAALTPDARREAEISVLDLILRSLVSRAYAPRRCHGMGSLVHRRGCRKQRLQS